MARISTTLILLASSLLASSAPAPEKRQISAYRPRPARCPSSPLTRVANGLSEEENEYLESRKPKADEALSTWLQSLDSGFSTEDLPTIGISSSGGGYRAMLSTAGVFQAFDLRDSDSNVSGIYQSTTYHAGVSGGSWFIGSFAGSNWETVSELQSNVWEAAFAAGPLLPSNILSIEGVLQTPLVVNQVLSKAAAGVDISLVDFYGRLLSYQFTDGFLGGAGLTLSDLTSKSNFESASVPYPLIIATGADASDNQCVTPSSPIYEFSPHEYGSWDTGISSFAQTTYMGSTPSRCLTNFDNLGFVYGASSNIFAGLCSPIEPSNDTTAPLENALQELLLENIPRDDPLLQDIFAILPNPFRSADTSPLVSDASELYLGDGALGDQNLPVWPFIQPDAPRIDVLIANDNSADTDDNFPDGTSLYATYQRAQAEGLARMPPVPPPATFIAEGLNTRAAFFGCDDEDALMIVYLPNTQYTFDSGVSTAQLVYSREETRALVANGGQVATQGGDEGWPLCLGCAVMRGRGEAPEGCEACFERYCWRGNA